MKSFTGFSIYSKSHHHLSERCCPAIGQEWKSPERTDNDREGLKIRIERLLNTCLSIHSIYGSCSGLDMIIENMQKIYTDL